jgi:hypothetical protein
MTFQLPNKIQNLENTWLDSISANPNYKQAHAKWKKWNVIHIVALIFSPLLVTIPFVFMAARKMKEAKVHEHVAKGLEAYQKKDWGGVIRHWNKFNDSLLAERFRKCLADYLPAHMDQDEMEVVKAVRKEASKEIKGLYDALFYPTTAACKSIKFKGKEGRPGEDNIFIAFNGLMGAACLHQASDILETSPHKGLEVKKCMVLADYYVGRVRGGSGLVSELKPTYEKINDLLKRNQAPLT